MRPFPGRSRGGSARRRGAVLILFAMLVFVFLAVAGLVIDVGVAQLTQAQMQTAVDTAALEGCRWRNYEEYPGQSYNAKRREAAELVRLVFDDDLHPTRDIANAPYTPENGPLLGADGPDERGFAAGPGLSVSGGVGTFFAQATLDEVSATEAAALDDPILAGSITNEAHGDQVSGQFVPGVPARETASYSRQDFVPTLGVAARQQALCHLVRMRRTGGVNPLDMLNGISTSLPRLPFLFAMGSVMLRAPGETWDPRRDGLTVRATAIASAAPTLRIGPSPRNPDGTRVPDHSTEGKAILGTYPFALRRDFWMSWMQGVTPSTWHTEREFRVESDRSLTYNTAPAGRLATDLHCVGREVVSPAPPIPLDLSTRVGYVPIYEPIPNASGAPVDRVVGYAFAEIPSSASTLILKPGFCWNGDVCLLNTWVAQDNASAHLDYTAPYLSAAEWQAVLSATFDLAYGDVTVNPTRAVSYNYLEIRRGTVLAPVLTR